MKRSRYGEQIDRKKHRTQKQNQAFKTGGFRCAHCKQFVALNNTMGTANRNHCNSCLWSKHVDETKGDRLSSCQGGMKPIGLTLKHEGYGRVGELMLIHLCLGCQKISINRIARDDQEQTLLAVYEQSLALNKALRTILFDGGIDVLGKKDKREIYTQLYGISES